MLYLKQKSPTADLVVQTEGTTECCLSLLVCNREGILALAPSSGHVREKRFANLLIKHHDFYLLARSKDSINIFSSIYT